MNSVRAGSLNMDLGIMANRLSTYLSYHMDLVLFAIQIWWSDFHSLSLKSMGIEHIVGDIWLPMVEPRICLKHRPWTDTTPSEMESWTMSGKWRRCMDLSYWMLCLA